MAVRKTPPPASAHGGGPCALLTRRALGLSADPWKQIETADGARVAHLVSAAVEARALVSIVGGRGSGKTYALRGVLGGIDAVVVEPCRLDRERLHIGDIVTALVMNLSSDPPRRGGEARSVQVRRLLGLAKRPVVLVVDDAHALHANTLKALKRLREMAWSGRSPLLSVVLAGQTNRLAAVPEVDLRTSSIEMSGLMEAEAGTAVSHALGDVCPSGLVARIAARVAASPREWTWLDLQRVVDEILAETVARGLRRIDAAAVDAVLPPVEASRPEAPPAAAVDAALERMTA